MGIIFVPIVAVCLAVLFMSCLRESRRTLEQQVGFVAQPEISDDEFCQLLPDVDPAVALKVREICADVAGWEREEVHPDTRIIEFELW